MRPALALDGGQRRPGDRPRRLRKMQPAPLDALHVTLEDKVRYLASAAAHPGGGTPAVIETHMSWVFLAGNRVLKLKKPVRTPFLDFSTLAAREFNCREEVRLNGRLAPASTWASFRCSRGPVARWRSPRGGSSRRAGRRLAGANASHSARADARRGAVHGDRIYRRHCPTGRAARAVLPACGAGAACRDRLRGALHRFAGDEPERGCCSPGFTRPRQPMRSSSSIAHCIGMRSCSARGRRPDICARGTATFGRSTSVWMARRSSSIASSSIVRCARWTRSTSWRFSISSAACSGPTGLARG